MSTEPEPLSVWLANPRLAFERFVQSDAYLKTSRRKQHGIDSERAPLPMSSKSKIVYVSMFGQYLAWLQTNKKTLDLVTHADLQAFLERDSTGSGKRDLNSAISLRYLRLLERVYQHLKIEPNPARHAIFQALDGRRELARDAPSVALTDGEIDAFMAVLPKRNAVSRLNDPIVGWKRRRDRAILALMLGAGLKESEIMRIESDHVGDRKLDGSVDVIVKKPSEGIGKDHITPLLPFAQEEVLSWVAERHKLRIPGELLFPAAFDGRAMDHATIYRQVDATFRRAEIAVERRGGRTLRNTYAVLCIRNGVPLDQVGERLGHFLERSAIPYAALSEAKSTR